MTATPLSAPGTPACASRPSPPFVHHTPVLLTSALAGIPRGSVTRFTESWNDLPADPHLTAGPHPGAATAPYRFRRYGRFRILGDRLERLPHAAFFQERSVNSVNGGVDRMFAPLHDAVADGPALHTVVRTLWDRLPGPRTGIDTCGVHQIRITATAGAEGHPTPEGIHRDGHCYVAQVLIRRENVRGAESCLYDLRRRPLHRTVLTAPLETIVLDDRRVLHGVSPLRPAPQARTGLRDMLLVDFFRGDARHSPERPSEAH
ncbi:2OG-Fe dioxygenase family protein [Streptomyces sp. SCA3-4]|uniref:2OG-Fe dioxygenase family protein n=1 Tax=Streptomyces sichuanensis TaxID=2871810 RepID=UPI001CE2A0C2|nr:2OG-Fe dioxygenase family protein [Streptomyces sichuanensis]MCA6096052.1 2OG-Fe dioxygenase family protein [Streptomyces sichuanensis]